VEIREAKKLERERLSYVKGEISGGAWLTKKIGNSDIVRGMEVVLLRREIKRSLIDKSLEQFKKERGEKHIIHIAFSPISRAEPEDEVDIKPLLEDARSSTQRMSELSADLLWPVIVLLTMEAHTVTSIDGKYELKNVKGGDYYLFASNTTEYSYVDWLVPVSVRDAEPLKIDLYNQTARHIKNKGDD
jgi:hypothetical protein